MLKLKEKFNYRLKSVVLKKFTEKLIDGIIGTLGEVFHELRKEDSFYHDGMWVRRSAKMITVDNKYFSVPQICGSGQCFRLDQTEDGNYEVIASDRYLKLEVTPDKTILYCSAEEYEGFWKTYFDLDTDYGAYLSLIDQSDDYLRRAADFGNGIRILRQDVWEMIITFILSQQNNIPRIKGLIRTLGERYGEKRETPEGKGYYTFPGAESLARATEEELRALKLGYRSRYICGTAQMAASGKVDLAGLSRMEYPEARKELMKLPGVGGKVADCICLFALHQLDAFPVDTHIKKVVDSQYGGSFPFDRYKGCAGIMQQYIFYYDLKGGADQ